jgi:hypothetical protein
VIDFEAHREFLEAVRQRGIAGFGRSPLARERARLKACDVGPDLIQEPLRLRIDARRRGELRMQAR